MNIQISTLEELNNFVVKIASELNPKETATVLALKGELGAGKTTFVQMLAKEFGITDTLTSPTFVIQKRYEILQNKTPFDQLIHIDAYRIEDPEELESLDWFELVTDPKNIICVEWPENVQKLIPDNATNINFVLNEDKTRTITYDAKN